MAADLPSSPTPEPMKKGVRTLIRATGEGAERVRAYLTDKIPEAVGADHAAEFVMTTCESFDEAVEDAAATASYARTRGEESPPIESVDRLMSSENPVRVWREYRRMSLAALADQAGIGNGYLPQIENGERTGTIKTMKKLAAAPGLELDDLV